MGQHHKHCWLAEQTEGTALEYPLRTVSVFRFVQPINYYLDDFTLNSLLATAHHAVGIRMYVEHSQCLWHITDAFPEARDIGGEPIRVPPRRRREIAHAQ